MTALLYGSSQTHLGTLMPSGGGYIIRATQSLTDQQRLGLLELFEERYQRRSTIITAQLPVSGWHEMIGEPTIADAILDRIIHNAHRIELKEDSMRQKSPTPGLTQTGNPEFITDEE